MQAARQAEQRQHQPEPELLHAEGDRRFLVEEVEGGGAEVLHRARRDQADRIEPAPDQGREHRDEGEQGEIDDDGEDPRRGRRQQVDHERHGDVLAVGETERCADERRPGHQVDGELVGPDQRHAERARGDVDEQEHEDEQHRRRGGPGLEAGDAQAGALDPRGRRGRCLLRLGLAEHEHRQGFGPLFGRFVHGVLRGRENIDVFGLSI